MREGARKTHGFYSSGPITRVVIDTLINKSNVDDISESSLELEYKTLSSLYSAFICQCFGCYRTQNNIPIACDKKNEHECIYEKCSNLFAKAKEIDNKEIYEEFELECNDFIDLLNMNIDDEKFVDIKNEIERQKKLIEDIEKQKDILSNCVA